MDYKLDRSQIKEQIRDKLSHVFGVSLENATDEEYYKAVVLIVRELLSKGRAEFVQNAGKDRHQAGLLPMYGVPAGPFLRNSLFNLGLEQNFQKALADYGIKLENLYEQEPDAGLGNGGLGRLAACFMDGLATQGYPAMGYSLRYEYGLFRQKLVDGWQTELPDTWLPGGDVWMQRVPESSVEVHFDGRIEEQWHDQYHSVRHKDYTTITAIPYDICIAGMDGKGVSLLRVWKAENDKFDMKLFNGGNYMRAMEQQAMAETITKVLYPEDNHTTASCCGCPSSTSWSAPPSRTSSAAT